MEAQAIEDYRQRLETRRTELMRRLGRIEHDLDQTPNADVEERATEREGDEVLEDLGQAGLAELRMIEAALVRIEQEAFAVCVKCGEQIAPERLDAVPHAALCRVCAGAGPARG